MAGHAIRNFEYRVWTLEPCGATGPCLRIGAESVALADIAGWSGLEEQERDIDGPMLTFALYMVLAIAFLVAVMLLDARPRLLVGGVVFAGIALFSLSDAIGMNRFSIFRLTLRTHAGREIRLATARREEAEGLAALLGAHAIVRRPG